jgi:uncharacterized protein
MVKNVAQSTLNQYHHITMKTLLIVSTESHAGKSILSLSLGQALNDAETPFAYMKPISSSVSYTTGEPIDRDAQAIRSILGLEDDVKLIAPVALEGPFLQEAVESGDYGFRRHILNSFNQITKDRKVALVEGRRYLGLGMGAGLSDFDLAETLHADILLLTRYDGEAAIDRILCAIRLLGSESRILGVILNSVSIETQLSRLIDVFSPFLDDRGAEVLGIVPYDFSLHSVYVEEIVELLKGRVVTDVPLDKEVRYFRIAATGPESALRLFRRTPDLGVITGGDRVEIQQAALAAHRLRCLILTGNHLPQREIIQKANARGVPIVLVGQEPMAAATLCDSLLSHSRICAGDRLDHAISLIRSNVDIDRILEKVEDR